MTRGVDGLPSSSTVQMLASVPHDERPSPGARAALAVLDWSLDGSRILRWARLGQDQCGADTTRCHPENDGKSG